MKTALFAAILLVAISAPAAYASTLQLVTENGNVFSIDYDEILATWELYHGNSTARTALNGTVLQEIDNLQMQINDLIAKLNSNSTETEIDKLEERVDDLLTQLNSNSTSTETEIERLGDLIANLTSNSGVAIDRLEQLIANLDNATESEITELNELLDELETDLLTQIDDLEAGTGVGAGALGSSGRLVSIPTDGIMALGVHTVRDTRGTVEPTTAYFYPEYDFDWVTLIRENEVYDEYEVPKLGAEYRANSGTQTLQETISSPQSVELNVNGLRPNTAFALVQNGTNAASYAGVTNSAGQMLIPRTPNDGVTITRGASFESSPNLEILDLKTVKDVITIDDWGTINDMHVTVTKIGSFSAGLVSPTGDLYPLLNGRSVTSSGSIEYIVDTTGEEMHGDWTLRFTSTYYTGATLLNWSISINHGGDYSLIESVSGSRNMYNVVVSPISSYGTYNLDLMDTTGIGTAGTTGVYPLDRTRDSGPDETHVVGGAELCPGDDLYVCLVENYNRNTWYRTHPFQFLVTFNKPVVNVDTRDFNILRCGSGYTTCDPYITAQDTALDVWHNSEQSVPNTSSISQRSFTSPSVKLIINASSPNDRNVDHWKLNLTAPNGNTIVITDGSTTTLDSSGGIHEFYLGEFADVATGTGNWVLSVIDETYDDDPTTYYGDEPEGQINSWSIVRDVGSSSSKLTVSRVTPQGTEGDQYLVDIYRAHRRGVSGTFTLWLDNGNDIESTSGETLNPRIEFGSNHHSVFHYTRYQPTALTSIIVTNSTYDSVTFQVGFGISAVGVNKTDFIVLENGVPDFSGSQVSTYTSAPDISVRGTADYTVSDTIIVNNQREGIVNNMTLNVDISHPRIGDLEVLLVAPDGTERYVHNNVGGNTIDLVSSFIPNFADNEVNGNWTLQVRDNVKLNTPGTLNSWSIDFSYEEPPTFDEFESIERDKGEAYTWREFLSGNYNLRIYPDAPIHDTLCSSNAIMIDGYNGGTACITNDAVTDTLIYTSGAYMKYPVTVDVNISNVHMASPSRSDASLRYIDGRYEAGSSFYIPIIPGMTTLKMNIAGSEASIDLADIAPPISVISLEPVTDNSHVTGTRRAIANAVSTVAFFAGEDKEYYAIMTLDVSGSMSYGINSVRDKGWHTQSDSLYRSAHGHPDRSGASFRSYNHYKSNFESGVSSTWGAAVKDAKDVACFRGACHMGTSVVVYVNGVMVDTYRLGSNPVPINSNTYRTASSGTVVEETWCGDSRCREYRITWNTSQTTQTIRSSQQGSASILPITLEDTIKVNAKVGDFVELVFVNRVSGFSLVTPVATVPAEWFGGSVPYGNGGSRSWSYTLSAVCASSNSGWCCGLENSDVYRGYTESKIINGYVLVI